MKHVYNQAPTLADGSTPSLNTFNPLSLYLSFKQIYICKDIIIIMKIIYIAPNPLKSSRRFTKSVTATLHYRSSTIKYTYKHIHSSCILMNQKKLKYKDGT